MRDKTDTDFRKQKLIIYISLTIITLAVYGQLHQFDFVNLDDVVYVTKNAHVQSGITPDSIRWAFSTTHAEFWHPLTWLSLMLDYELYGLNAGGYHVTNLLFHILSTLLLFWLFSRMTGEIWKSAFVAAFFALHPLHVESVAWIAERKDVLSAFFWMLTLCLYVYYTESPTLRKYLLVLFSFACGLMSKPMVVTLPVIMILLDYWPLKRFENQKRLSHLILWQLKEKMLFFVLSAFFSIITLLVQPQGGPPLVFRTTHSLLAFFTYLKKIFWPHDLAVYYPFPNTFSALHLQIFAILIFILCFLIIAKAKRLPYLIVGWLWYVIALLPVIGIIRTGFFFIADHYMYLPSVGIAIILSWGIPDLFRSQAGRKKYLFPAGVAILIMLATLSWKQCGYWKNSYELFNHAVLATKDNYLALTNRGNAHNKFDLYQKAIDDCNEALRLKPDYPYAFFNRGFAYARLGRFQAAIDDLSEGIRLKSDDESAFCNRGLAYAKLENYKAALNDYNEAVRLKPDYAEAFYNRGNAYIKLKQYQAALNDYNEAMRLKPDYAEAYYNRGNVYAELGQPEYAIRDYNKGIHLKPDDAEAYYNQGNVYYKTGRYQMALENYTRAILLKPDYAEAYYNRGNVYVQTDQYKLAIENYSKAIALDSDYMKAYNNRGVAYYKLGQQSLAIKDYNDALRLEPNHAEAYYNLGNAYAALSQDRYAIKNYNEAIRLKPNFARAYEKRVLLFFKKGDKASGCRDARKACELGSCAKLEEMIKKRSCR